ncbi:MAG: YHS domain-containing (seleno)protein [Wenzhouxiangellaceae bacterium]|nr:YHS domain-containing (seleno)protein [Wenzhouxiangellaceae bacterium]
MPQRSCCSPCSQLPTSAQNEPPRLAIEGYSPNSYFEQGRPEKDLPEFTAVYKDRRYQFTDAAQQTSFEANPAAYAPVFPNHCRYNLSLGRAARIDPTPFKIVGDTLLLFHRSEEMDGLERWNEHGDDLELLRRAESNRTLLDF